MYLHTHKQTYTHTTTRKSTLPDTFCKKVRVFVAATVELMIGLSLSPQECTIAYDMYSNAFNVNRFMNFVFFAFFFVFRFDSKFIVVQLNILELCVCMGGFLLFANVGETSSQISSQALLRCTTSINSYHPGRCISKNLSQLTDLLN